MTENKYYTPSIEELHIGFEYEMRTEDTEGNTVYEKNTIHEGFGNVMRELIRIRCIRVKYLDKQDVEECGWKKSAEQKELYSINWIENADEKKNCIWMAKVNENKYQITDCRHTWHFVLFAGTIKNKSELKRIMKMICIDPKD